MRWGAVATRARTVPAGGRLLCRDRLYDPCGPSPPQEHDRVTSKASCQNQG
jgi:hypothetical protein